MEDNEVKQKRKRQTYPDRIVLDPKSMDAIKTFANQLEEVFNGIVTLTSKDIANFILQNRCEVFSKTELDAIRNIHYDDVRAAMIAVERLKAAKAAGETLTLADVLGKMQTPSVTKKPAREGAKMRRKKSDATPSAPIAGGPDSEPIEAINGA